MGKSTQERTYRIPSRGAGTFDLGFEVIPLDFESDPNFEVIEGGQLLRSGGQRADLAASLTNTDPDPRLAICALPSAVNFKIFFLAYRVSERY